MKHFFVLVMMASVLSGCSLFSQKEPERVVVKETKYVKVEVPDQLYKPCVAERPIPKSEYLMLKPVEREQYLTDYTIGLLGVINDCNENIKGIKRIVDQANKPVKGVSNDSQP